MGNMEQMPLNFQAPETLERLSTEELKTRYVESVGYEPGLRFIGKTEDALREIYMEGINDKEAGLQRLRDIDAGDDGMGDAWSGK
jgi:hypothetical protein